MMNRKIALALTAAAAVAALAGCKGSAAGSSHVITFSPSALATNTAVQQAKADFQHCIPSSSLGQIALANKLMSDTKKHPNGAWAQLLTCLGITQANKPVVEQKLLTAAENAHPSLLTKAGRKQYFEVTLPGIVTSVAAATPSPSVSR